MADHDVSFTIPERALGKADIEFKIKRNGKAFGRLRVSEGSMVWVPANKSYGYRLGWTTFDGLAQEKGDQGYQ
jgi:hypothetical protein